MRVIDHIATPWSPYAVTFSHDGTRLALGGGAWYGLGGIAMIDLKTHEQRVARLGDLDPVAFASTELSPQVAAIEGTPWQGGSVSNLAFSSDDRHLMVASWTSRHYAGPILAFEVADLALRSIASHLIEPGPANTGLVPYGPGVVVRRWDLAANDALTLHPWPTGLGIDRTRGRTELTNHRVVIAHGHAITGNHGIDNGASNMRLQPGLVLRSLATGATTYVPSSAGSISAIGSGPLDTIITGTIDGQLAEWTWYDGTLRLARVIGEVAVPSELRWTAFHTYAAASVVGICAMTDGRMVAVTAGGMVATWRGGEPLTMWTLPVAGTPRTIAASPDRSVVAIGVKMGGAGAPESVVVLVDIETEVIPDRWRTDKTRAMARTADLYRAPGGAFDPAHLDVLADALEEAGGRPRVLHHLRNHDRRLRRCWVLDELRE